MRTLIRRQSLTLPHPRAGAHDTLDDAATQPRPAEAAPATPDTTRRHHVVALSLAAVAVAGTGLGWAVASGSGHGAAHQTTPPANNSDLNRLLDPSPLPGHPFPGREAFDELVGTR